MFSQALCNQLQNFVCTSYWQWFCLTPDIHTHDMTHVVTISMDHTFIHNTMSALNFVSHICTCTLINFSSSQLNCLSVWTRGSDHIDISAGAAFPRPLSYGHFFNVAACNINCNHRYINYISMVQRWKTGSSRGICGLNFALPAFGYNLRMHVAQRENPSIRIPYRGRLCASGSGRMRIRYGEWFCAECACFVLTAIDL